MEIIVQMIFMIVIGAFIGGLTNFIAIKMLFRPLRPLYIGKWQLPFSPGVIPKRRGEIAAQLGNLVVNYLFTAEMLKQRWEEFGFSKEIEKALTKWVKGFFQSQETLADYCTRFGHPEAPDKIQRYFVTKSLEQYREIIAKNENRLLRNLLPESLQEDLQARIPELSKYIVSKIKVFVQSEHVRVLLERRLEKAVDGKGMFSQMARSLIGNLHIGRWMQDEIVNLVDDERFQVAVKQILLDEWERLLDQTIGELAQKVDHSTIPSLISEIIDVQGVFAKPIRNLPLTDLEKMIVDVVIPRAVEIGSGKLLEALPRLLEKIDIAQLVEDQVNSYSLEKLEELILSFTKKELSMITHLGAYLGGFIGLIQGLLTMLF